MQHLKFGEIVLIAIALPCFALNVVNSVNRKNRQMSKKLPKNDFTRKMILTPLQKLPKFVGYLSKLIVAPGFKKLPKVQ